MLAELGEGAPRQVGPYRILARLGAGGMGEVYLGADVRPGPAGTGRPRLAAVKTIRADLGGDPAFRDRFRREIATARTVEGRFTARLLSGDAEAAEPWMATEYVAGPTLERAVRDTGPLPAGTVRNLGLGLVRALRGIHHARVQHRDLKPANVLLGADGPRVIDFGIARDFGAATLTATGAMVGSPGYMSPEHVLGGRHVVAASDIFCLGTVLCYAATGESPFGHGPVAAVLYRISQADADLGAVPEELRELIADCLSADPFARPDAVALESRFAAAAQAAGEPEDAAPWPPAVQALVARYEEELARVVAQAGPVAGPAPTMPGASPVHSAETVGGPPSDPVPTPPPPSRPSRRTVLTVVAAAVVVGVLGAFGLRAVQNASQPQKEEAAGAGPAPSGTATAEVEEKPSGLDEYGVDGSRHFPVDPSARPAGWKPWTARLASRPAECTLNPEILVCLTEDGGLVAVGTADGKPRWKAPSAVPGGKAEQAPLRGVRFPGAAKEPVIYGDTVISYASGKLGARSVSDGTVRWEESVADVELANKAPMLMGGGAVFLTSQSERGVRVHAFDADTGKPLWNRTLSNQTGISSVGSHYMAWVYAGGRVLGTNEGGLTGFEARTGAATHYALEGGGACDSLSAGRGVVRCAVGSRAVMLDEKTLRPADDDATPSPLGDSRGADGVRTYSPVVLEGIAYWLGWADGGDRVVLQKQGDPSARTVARLPQTEEGVRTSEPSVVGTTAVVADNKFLYTLPVDGGGSRRYAITGAPGNEYRVEDAGFGMDRWGPQLISLGGLLYLAFHDGTVRSFELPTA